MAEDQPLPPSDPTMFDRRKVALGLALGAAAGITFARLPRTPIDYLGKRKLDNIIPRSIGEWRFEATSGLIVPTEDALSAALYSQLVTRVYTRPNAPAIMLLVAQSAAQTGILQIHRPEFCYPAGGFVLSPIVQRPVPQVASNFVVNELTATRPGRTEQIMYWTRVGNAMPPTWADQRLSIAADNLRGYIPDAVLARVSVVDDNPDQSFAILGEFVEDMLRAMGPDRRLLVADA